MVANKKALTYLITGGTGSMGTAICKELLKGEPKSIRIYDNHEYSVFQMQQDIKDNRVRFLIGDVRDSDRLSRAMSGVDIVIHCAALKHVPLCEYNPIESVRTNVDGSVNMINAAIDAKVSKVMAISTDKSVYPINIYGATKLVAEKLILDAGVYGNTVFSIFRSGNFWGSSGSVVELWQNSTGTIDITHPDMRRYIMSIEKGAELVVRLINTMKGGEIFVPKMQEETLATIAKMVAPDAKWNIIGLRPGEKMREKLYTDEEFLFTEEKEDYYVIGGK
jgi:FlaA1/EpsC-like NDP-sugar epimerase